MWHKTRLKKLKKGLGFRSAYKTCQSAERPPEKKQERERKRTKKQRSKKKKRKERGRQPLPALARK